MEKTFILINMVDIISPSQVRQKEEKENTLFLFEVTSAFSDLVPYASSF